LFGPSEPGCDEHTPAREEQDQRHAVQTDGARAGKANGERNGRCGGDEGCESDGGVPRDGIVDEEELQARAECADDCDHVEHREIGKVVGVDDGPCGVPESEHATRADRRPAFALEPMRDGTGNWGLPHQPPFANPVSVCRSRRYERAAAGSTLLV
jgi:hypothetical protein